MSQIAGHTLQFACSLETFGIFLPENAIYIGFFDDNSWVPQKISKNIKAASERGSFYERHKEKEHDTCGDYWFKLKKEKCNILCDESKSKEEQEKVLKDFFEEVMHAIGAEKYL